MSQKSQHTAHDKDSKSHLADIFSSEKLKPNTHLLHLAVLRQLNNARAGTAKVKTRAEVSGGGAKPWVQKGTGRARAGSIRSPLWVGGGVSHGPKQRSYKTNLSKKASNIAMAQALVAKGNSTVIIKSVPEIKDGKTKLLVNYLKSHEYNEKPLLIVVSKDEPHFTELRRACSNLRDVTLKDGGFVGAYDFIKANKIVITEKGLNKVESRIKPVVAST